MTQKIKRPLRRRALSANEADIGAHRAKHLSLARVSLQDMDGSRSVTINEAESPLIWLARRKGRDGRALIDEWQLLAGERLRAEFTRANAVPRMGADWSSPIGSTGSGDTRGTFSESAMAARQRLRRALDAAGPEFAGILLDVCCFLKGLEDVERERGWPARSGKIILQLGLDCLARHYGLNSQSRGPQHAPLRFWAAKPDKTEMHEESSGGEGGLGVGTDSLDHRS